MVNTHGRQPAHIQNVSGMQSHNICIHCQTRITPFGSIAAAHKARGNLFRDSGSVLNSEKEYIARHLYS